MGVLTDECPFTRRTFHAACAGAEEQGGTTPSRGRPVRLSIPLPIICAALCARRSTAATRTARRRSREGVVLPTHILRPLSALVRAMRSPR